MHGKDVDHIWPEKLGGAAHPGNYQVIDSHVNRADGASIADKLEREPIDVLRGLTVSALAVLACR